MVLIGNALCPFSFINPVATLLIVISFVIKASCILQEPLFVLTSVSFRFHFQESLCCFFQAACLR